ncbi:MAG: methionine--tRNA ligase subunit beta, partial [Acidobacteria bacterium]|nr:methionine--tRNA ligase subunit beta [Acidobacteriota bacterium]
FENFEFSRALETLWQFIGRINKYLVETQPWVLAGKPDEASRAKLSTVLYTSAEAVRLSAVLLYPVTPRSAQKLWAQLGFTGVLENQRFKDLAWGGLPAGQKTGAAEAIFPRLDKKETVQKITAAIAAEEKPKNGNEKGKGKGKKMSSEVFGEETGIISIDDFAKVDLRVGEIKTAERIEGATKLLKLTVDIGSEVRQVLAGIAEYYEPESLVGRKVVVVANLKPRKMRGHESQGMVVAASLGEEGKPVLVTFTEEVPNGARLR